MLPEEGILFLQVRHCFLLFSLFPQEVLYAWNAFVLLAKSPPLLRNMLRCTWNELLVIENTKGTWGLV